MSNHYLGARGVLLGAAVSHLIARTNATIATSEGIGHAIADHQGGGGQEVGAMAGAVGGGATAGQDQDQEGGTDHLAGADRDHTEGETTEKTVVRGTLERAAASCARKRAT